MEPKSEYVGELFRSVGFHKTPCVDRIFKVCKAHGKTDDEAWMHVHYYLLQAFIPDRFPVSAELRQKIHRPYEEDTLKKKLLELHARLDAPEKVLAVVLDIARDHMDRLPSKRFYGPTDDMLAKEACLWRAFDALDSASKLQPHGLLFDCQLSLRAATEAMLLFNVFHKEPARATEFIASGLIKDAELALEYITYNQETYGAEDVKLRTKFNDICAELANRGVTLVSAAGDAPRRDPSAKSFRLLWKGIASREEWGWRTMLSMANPFEDTHEETADIAFRKFHDLLADGNRSAHNLPLWWMRLIRFEGDRTVCEARAVGDPVRLGYGTYMIFRLFLTALRTMRPSLKTDYAHWAWIIYMISSIWEEHHDLDEEINTS